MKTLCYNCHAEKETKLKSLDLGSLDIGHVKLIDVEPCEVCGTLSCLAGEKGLSIQDNKLTCSCDQPSINFTMHLNATEIHYTLYECSHCGNYIVSAEDMIAIRQNKQ